MELFTYVKILRGEKNAVEKVNKVLAANRFRLGRRIQLFLKAVDRLLWMQK